MQGQISGSMGNPVLGSRAQPFKDVTGGGGGGGAVQLYVLTAISVVIHNMSTSLSFIQHLIGNLVTPGDYTYPHFGVADHSFKCCDIHTEKRHTLISGYTHSDFTGNSLISRFSC